MCAVWQVAVFGVAAWTVLWWNLTPVLLFAVLCFIAGSEAQLVFAKMVSIIYAFIMMAVIVATAIQVVLESKSVHFSSNSYLSPWKPHVNRVGLSLQNLFALMPCQIELNWICLYLSSIGSDVDVCADHVRPVSIGGVFASRRIYQHFVWIHLLLDDPMHLRVYDALLSHQSQCHQLGNEGSRCQGNIQHGSVGIGLIAL